MRLGAKLFSMRLERLRGRKICDHVLRKGKVWRGKHMQVRFLLGSPRHPALDPAHIAVYCGVLASQKLSKSAVKRNRMRRRVREALRTVLKGTPPPLSQSVQLFLCPHSSSLSASFAALQQDVRSFLSNPVLCLRQSHNRASSNSS
jgi:ribonuclease P protein component